MVRAFVLLQILQQLNGLLQKEWDFEIVVRGGGNSEQGLSDDKC
jgi:hypothetical protein